MLCESGPTVPYGITQCYVPPDRGDIPTFIPAKASTRFSDPRGMQGWVDSSCVKMDWLVIKPTINNHKSNAPTAAPPRKTVHAVICPNSFLQSPVAIAVTWVTFHCVNEFVCLSPCLSSKRNCLELSAPKLVEYSPWQVLGMHWPDIKWSKLGLGLEWDMGLHVSTTAHFSIHCFSC